MNCWRWYMRYKTTITLRMTKRYQMKRCQCLWRWSRMSTGTIHSTRGRTAATSCRQSTRCWPRWTGSVCWMSSRCSVWWTPATPTTWVTTDVTTPFTSTRSLTLPFSRIVSLSSRTITPTSSYRLWRKLAFFLGYLAKNKVFASDWWSSAFSTRTWPNTSTSWISSRNFMGDSETGKIVCLLRCKKRRHKTW